MRMICHFALAIALSGCAANSATTTIPAQTILNVSPSVATDSRSAKSEHALYVLDVESSGGAVRVYKGGGAAFLRTVQPALNSLLQYAVGQNGRLYVGTVANDGKGLGTLSIYANRGSKFVRSFKQRKYFAGLTIDDQGNLFSFCTGENICERANAKNPITRKLKGVLSPLAVDHSGNLAASSCPAWNAEACVFAPGETTPSWKITSGLFFDEVHQLAFDPSGNLHITNFGNATPSYPGNVAVFAPMATSPTRVISSGIAAPISLALDSAGSLYVYNDCGGSYTSQDRCSVDGGSITVYKSGESTPTRKITTGVSYCEQYFPWPNYGASCLAVDSSGNIYAVNTGVNVVEYKPGSDTPFRTLTDSQYPIAAALGP